MRGPFYFFMLVLVMLAAPMIANAQTCPNSGYCMDDYWACKGGHGDNEYNEYCDFAVQSCLYGQHIPRNVRTNDHFSLAFAIRVCAHDGFWEAFSPHIYLQGGHTFTDQVWDDWYCENAPTTSTLVSSTNGSETCYSKTDESCGIESEDIGGECTFPQ